MTKQNKSKYRKETGSVLVLIVFLVLISMFIGTGLLALGTQVRIEAMDKVQDTMARSAADAGIEFAIQQINNAVENKTWSPYVLPQTDNIRLFESDSMYSVKTQYDTSTGYIVQSTGTNGNRTRSIIATLQLKGLFDMAILCRENVILKNGTIIHAIDSDISLDPDDTDEEVMIGTNSVKDASVILNKGVVVDGDVVVGAGGDVATVIKDLGASALDRYSMTAEVEFPSVDPPALTGPDTMIEVEVGEKTIGAGGDYPAVGRFSGIFLKQGCILKVIDDCILYITGDVNLGQASEIIIDSSKGASLVIYLDGNWRSDSDSGVTNTTKSASAFELYGTGPVGQFIDLKAKSDLFGVVYAPNADLTVYAGSNFYGALVAENFELKSPGYFYYDAALQDAVVGDEGVRYIISRWDEQ